MAEETTTTATVSPSVAVKKFFEKDSIHGPITTGEFMGFWKALSAEEKQSFAEAAATDLGYVMK